MHNIFPCIIVHRFEWKILRWGADQSFIEIEVTYHKTLPFYILFFKIEVYLIYYIMLVSSVQQNDSITYIYTQIIILFQIIIYFHIVSIIGCYKILNIAP